MIHYNNSVSTLYFIKLLPILLVIIRLKKNVFGLLIEVKLLNLCNYLE